MLSKNVIFEYLIVFASAILVGVTSTKTDYVITFLLMFALILLLLRKKIFLFVAILMNESLFYFVDPNKIPIINILIILVVFFAVISFKIKRKYYFKNAILILLVISIFEVINSYIINGQPLIIGIYAVKSFCLYLFYFYFIDNYKSIDDLQSVEKFIIITGFIASLIYFTQAILYDKMIFLHVDFFNARLGNVRFYTGFTYVIFSFFLTISKIFTQKATKWYFLLIAVFEFISIIFVSQTRNFLIGIIIGLLWIIYIQKKFSKIWFSLAIILFIIIVIYLGDVSLIKLIYSVYLESVDKSGTVGFRIKEIEFYWNQIINHPIFGVGIYSTKFPESYYITGLVHKYYLSDVGIIGFIFQTGLIGFIWLVYFISKIISLIIKVYVKDRDSSLFFSSFMVYCLATIFSTFYFGLLNSIIYITVMISMLEIEYKQLYKKDFNWNIK